MVAGGSGRYSAGGYMGTTANSIGSGGLARSATVPALGYSGGSGRYSSTGYIGGATLSTGTVGYATPVVETIAAPSVAYTAPMAVETLAAPAQLERSIPIVE